MSFSLKEVNIFVRIVKVVLGTEVAHKDELELALIETYNQKNSFPDFILLGFDFCIFIIGS